MHITTEQAATLVRRHERIVRGWILSNQLETTIDPETHRYAIDVAILLAFMEKQQTTAMDISDDAAITKLASVEGHCDKQQEQLDPDSLEYQRYRIAANSAGKARAALSGERDVIIKNEMERSKVNLAAHWQWCQESGRGHAYDPGRDYTRVLAEFRAHSTKFESSEQSSS